MGAGILSPRSTRRIARATGLDVVRAWGHGGYVHGFVTADHRHGSYSLRDGAWEWDQEPVTHYSSCSDVFPGWRTGPAGGGYCRTCAKPVPGDGHRPECVGWIAAAASSAGEAHQADGGSDDRWQPSESVDRRVVQCNYVSGTGVAAAGARAYLVRGNPGNGHDRIVILVRSRGGRWVEKYEDIRRLDGFRGKTLPPEHPMFRDERIWDWHADETAATLAHARARRAGA